MDEAGIATGFSAARVVRRLRRLGKNVSGYSGETIDIAAVLRDCRIAAQTKGWCYEPITADPGLELAAFHRKAIDPGGPRGRVYLSAGIHGDEPAGPLAISHLLAEDRWPQDLDIWVCPCLNPTGFAANRRENHKGTDLNRQYLQPQAMEVVAHITWLERQPRFDLCICLHEDWEAHGFYLYELNPDQLPSLAESIIAGVAEACPIDYSDVIDGRAAKQGIIRPNEEPLSRPQWPEAFFLLMHKTRLSYTLEAPSDYPLPARVQALIVAVETALEKLNVNPGRAPM